MTGSAYAVRGAVVETAPPSRYVEHVMGMPLSLALRGRHRTDHHARAAWAAVTAELREVDAVFSTYREDSWVSRLNRGEPPATRADVTEVLTLAAAAASASGGAFTTWLPGPDGATRLDPSGVVKGWAVQRASRHLAVLPETDFCLALAGDLVCWTADPSASGWRVGIADPSDDRRLLSVVELRSGALATSGTSRRGAHLVDGRTGRPATGLRQVSVIAASLTDADVWATTAFALGEEGKAWLSARPQASGLLVRPDGTTSRVGAWA